MTDNDECVFGPTITTHSIECDTITLQLALLVSNHRPQHRWKGADCSDDKTDAHNSNGWRKVRMGG